MNRNTEIDGYLYLNKLFERHIDKQNIKVIRYNCITNYIYRKNSNKWNIYLFICFTALSYFHSCKYFSNFLSLSFFFFFIFVHGFKHFDSPFFFLFFWAPKQHSSCSQFSPDLSIFFRRIKHDVKWKRFAGADEVKKTFKRPWTKSPLKIFRNVPNCGKQALRQEQSAKRK